MTHGFKLKLLAASYDWEFHVVQDGSMRPDFLKYLTVEASHFNSKLVQSLKPACRTLLVRRSDWSLQFLERVASSRFTVAWDQWLGDFVVDIWRRIVRHANMEKNGAPGS